MIDRVGQQFGNYELVKLLGQGGYAKVYLGKHRYLNSYAALKVLNATFHPGDEAKFLTEAQTLVGLRHSNIVHLLDFGIENGTAVLIMDYAPKGSVRHHYPHGTQMPLTTVVDFVAQIAAALQYAHNHSIIHRDVKPENILLDADNRLLLSDFGLSLLTPSSEQLSTQDPAGTPRYMAPEQLRGKPCMASDQYALAVMVYEWLCGDLPFRGTLWEIWHQHLHAAPPPLRAIRPELPPTLETVIGRALAKQPQERFVSIQAFARALARASQLDTPVDENDSQVTIPLQAIPRSSPIAPPATLAPRNNQIATKVSTAATTQQPHASALQNQNRIRMLGRLRRSYHDLMSQSLQGATWLELGIASKPDAVQNAANLVLHIERRAVHHLPAGTSITQAYDEAEHELLILGEPGAGKSTLLLDLAEHLVKRAATDQTHSLPVILPLSTWATKRPKLEDWIAEQMFEIYDVPRRLSVEWVQEGRILPLLDGLDEMEETARPACIAAINTYHREHLAALVVCSRTIEYEMAAERSRLALQGAVIVQPLTHEDIEAYLVRAGKPLMALRETLKKNAALHDLATTPLMLNILILTYQDSSVRDMPRREDLLQEQVWDDYVQRMVARKGDSNRYPLTQTRSWLSWLARQMREHNQTVFYVEHLQPDWLTTSQKPAYMWQAVHLPAILIGALVSILVVLFFIGTVKTSDLSTYLRSGVMGGLLGRLWYGSAAEKGKRREHLHVWGKRLVKRLAISACIGLTYWLSFPWRTHALAYGVAMGLGSLLLQYFLAAPFHPAPSPETSTPQRRKWGAGFWSAVQGPRALLVAVVIGLSYTLSVGPLFGPLLGLNAGMSSGISYGLISLALNAQVEDIRPAERLSWSWRSLRRGLFNSRHLRITVLLTCILVIFAGAGMGLSKGLSFALSFGLNYWCLLGLFQGVAQGRIENEDRRTANQGIHRSLHNSVTMGIISGGTIGGMGILSFWLALRLDDGLSHGLSPVLSYGPKIEQISEPSSILGYGLQLGICGALLVFLLTGGLAVLRHYIIRLLLWHSRTFPEPAPQFLDDATARFLLRRVGGGYSFTHRLLLDHLADRNTGATPNVSGLPTQPPIHRKSQ